MVHLVTLEGRPLAEMVASLLEQQGIPSLVRSPVHTGLFGASHADSLLSFEVMVNDEDLEAATSLLSEIVPAHDRERQPVPKKGG